LIFKKQQLTINDSSKSWNGFNTHGELVQGVYIYKIIIYEETPFQLNGTVTLLR